jgi:hypothetical protein
MNTRPYGRSSYCPTNGGKDLRKNSSIFGRRYADRIGDRFGVEAPNDKAIKLHLKLGHMKPSGDTITGTKCFFVPSF